MYAKTTLPALAMSPGVARRWALDVLTVELSPVQRLAPVLDLAHERTEVIVSELVTNAIVHARSDMTLALTVTAPDADQVQIKVEVTDDVGHAVSDFGKTVWAQFALAVPARPATPVQRARVAT